MKPGASHSMPLPNSKLRVHEDSHLISKNIVVPKIRIIHIFEPKIIKTDEANFRELVQSLTGRRARSKGATTITKTPTICQPEVRSNALLEPKKTAQSKRWPHIVQDSDHSQVLWKESNHQQILNPVSRKSVSVSNMRRVMKSGNPIFQNEERVKKELVFDQDTYKGQSSNHGFPMDGFSDMEGLFQDPSELLPNYSQINIFGGMPYGLFLKE